ncbi:MAG TPA: hypothetical protein VFH88_15330 [Candidatus Krumholzibacteria bacterium]|nr:hypothetical protein [Candidatus Krumholzibacteria bacterium]
MSTRLAVVLGVIVLCACDDRGADVSAIYNHPPQVWIAAGPPEGGTVPSPVHFYWGGWDKDGAIKGFEYILTANEGEALSPYDTVGVPWSPVNGFDSVFVVTNDSIPAPWPATGKVGVRSHTFLLHAIDDQGRRSAGAAVRTFHVE